MTIAELSQTVGGISVEYCVGFFASLSVGAAVALLTGGASIVLLGAIYGFSPAVAGACLLLL